MCFLFVWPYIRTARAPACSNMVDEVARASFSRDKPIPLILAHTFSNRIVQVFGSEFQDEPGSYSYVEFCGRCACVGMQFSRIGWCIFVISSSPGYGKMQPCDWKDTQCSTGLFFFPFVSIRCSATSENHEWRFSLTPSRGMQDTRVFACFGRSNKYCHCLVWMTTSWNSVPSSSLFS